MPSLVTAPRAYIPALLSRSTKSSPGPRLRHRLPDLSSRDYTRAALYLRYPGLYISRLHAYLPPLDYPSTYAYHVRYISLSSDLHPPDITQEASYKPFVSNIPTQSSKPTYSINAPACFPSARLNLEAYTFHERYSSLHPILTVLLPRLAVCQVLRAMAYDSCLWQFSRIRQCCLRVYSAARAGLRSPLSPLLLG